MQNIVRNGNYVQNHININTDIILLYGILQITVLFYMCAVFALGALHNFQISSGGKGKGTRGQLPPAIPLAPPMNARYDVIWL